MAGATSAPAASWSCATRTRGWVNAGTYRVQLHDEQTLGLYISPGKHGRMIRDKYWARGQACPVAVSVGHDPLLLLLGGLEVDYGKNEYDVAGGIRGEPLEVVARAVHGPAGAGHGGDGVRGRDPAGRAARGGSVRRVGRLLRQRAEGGADHPACKSVLHRDDPIVLGCIPGKPPNDNTFYPQPAARGAHLGRAGALGHPGHYRRLVARGGRRAVVQHRLDQADVPGPRQAGGHGDGELPRRRLRQPLRASSWTTTSTRPTRTRCCGRCARAPTWSTDIDVIKTLLEHAARPDGLRRRGGPQLLQQPHDHRRLPALRPTEDVPGDCQHQCRRRRAPAPEVARRCSRRTGKFPQRRRASRPGREPSPSARFRRPGTGRRLHRYATRVPPRMPAPRAARRRSRRRWSASCEFPARRCLLQPRAVHSTTRR